MSYFEEQYRSFSYPVGADGRPGFREAQLGAIHAVAGHFSQRSEPAIVTMPTGSGKTAVMIACAFVMRAKRVLIVTPSRLVREQIAEQVETMSLLIELSAIPADSKRPSVSVVGKRVTTAERWKELYENDVVVGTVQSISPALNGVAQPEPDQFDLVIVDEAHHSAAKTWHGLLECFPDARRVLFTATPFRRDRREIQGRFVFTYGMREARNDGVFGRIRFQAVEVRGDERARDIAVAQAAETQLRNDRADGLDHLIMVRTDRKARAQELRELYAEHTNLRLVLLHSGHSLRYAKRVIRQLHEGELDGIIAVNMLGEGFDLPRLKIAAIHAPHRSLAATLQFIGRFARTTVESIGAATFLAVPDDIEIERRKLFEVGAAWDEVVENLSTDQMEREAHVREVLDSFEVQGSVIFEFGDLSLYSLEPYHHVKIYRTHGDVDLHADLDFPGDAAVVYRTVSETRDASIWITREQSAVRWARNGRIVDVQHNLFVLHFDEEAQLLFICASIRTEGVYEKIAAQLMEGEPRILPLARINRALSGLTGLEFFNVGMRNRIPGNQTESYRIITGPSAAEAILPSDGRLFHRGHCFGRGETEGRSVTIGLSSASKVWSNQTSQIPELIGWCSKLARRIQADRVPLTGGGLDHLSPGDEVDKLPPGIFHADWDPSAYKTPRVATIISGGARNEVQLLDIEIRLDRDACTESSVALVFLHDTAIYRATFSYETERLFEPIEGNDIDIDVVAGTSRVSLVEYLNEHPLYLYTDDLSLLAGFDLHRSSQDGKSLFSVNQIESVDWDAEEVDVRVEFGGSARARRSVHDYVEARLADSGAQVVYYDHGSGEIADFVTFAQDDGRVEIEFLHCKRAGGTVPGDRVEDVYEVCAQAVKSVVYADPADLTARIAGRYERRAGAAKFVRGSIDELNQLAASRARSMFDFSMVVVQPGIGRDLSDRMANVLSAANDHLIRGGFRSLRVIGS